MAPLLRNLLLFAPIIASSFAIPTFDSHDDQLYPQASGRSASSKSIYQRVRDSVIEKIWHIPKKSDCHPSNVRSDQSAPSKFRAKYDNEVVLRFKITTEHEARAFSEAVNVLYLDVWDSSNDWVDVRVAKDMLPSFLTLLPTSLQNAHTPLMHDLTQAVYGTYPSSNTDSWRTRTIVASRHHGDGFFHNYQPLSVLYPWLQLQASLYPNHVEYFSIGKSAEGRNIPAIKVGAPLEHQEPDKDVNGRRTILIVGGTHAREWISTSTVTYLVHQFATRYDRDRSYPITKLLKHYDIIFVPVLNPDGYEYTWSNDRLWRKNRQATSLPFCPGIDLNRAFGIRWDGDDDKDNPCSESYAGEHAFQGVEAKVLAEWAQNQTRDNNVVFNTYLDLHSYSQKVLYPYSYSCEATPYNEEDLEELAIGIAKSFRLTAGRRYGVESACESQVTFINEVDGKRVRSRVDKPNKNGGSSLDFFYDGLRVKWSYQIKLRDQGTYGFLLPREYIIPTGRETFEAVVGLGRWLLSNRGIESTADDMDEGLQSSEEELSSEKSLEEWMSRTAEGIFKPQLDQTHAALTQEDDDEEWERIYDAELRRR